MGSEDTSPLDRLARPSAVVLFLMTSFILHTFLQNTFSTRQRLPSVRAVLTAVYSLHRSARAEPQSTLAGDSLSGLAYLNPHVELYDTTIIARKPSSDRVHLICGGGGGHEPAHAAFVGQGMLSAAVSGNVFASPNARQVEKALDKLKSGKGTLVIVRLTADCSPSAHSFAFELAPSSLTLRCVLLHDPIYP